MAVDETTNAGSTSLFTRGENCWDVARADQFSLIVDAADYFRVLRRVLANAQREVLLIGWDFDFEIDMLPGESDSDGNAPDGLPNQLGPFMEAIVEQAPDLNIYMLKWNGAVLIAPGRLIPSLAMYAFGNDRIHFALDGHHPFGSCHHQKIVVADGSFAFCGGIDMTENRWDTCDHTPDDPRRARKDGTLSEPWHDATSAMTGPAAAALADLSRTRWLRATGNVLDKPDGDFVIEWPDALSVDATDVDVAIARTEPPYDGEPLVNEIERLTLDSIASARHTIYIESQYFAAETLCDALKQRLQEDGGPEVVVINPQAALSEFEDDAMHVLRGRMIADLKAADHQDRFRIYHPVNDAHVPIYVHAKIMIVDDEILRIGSSNMNDRSLGFDTECDVAIEGHNSLIAAFRRRLLCEHLDTTWQSFDKAFEKDGSLIAAIEQRNPTQGRRLCPIEQQSESIRGKILADTQLMDPRFHRGEATMTGQGLRPRHLAFGAGAVLLGVLAWKGWSRLRGGRR